MAFAGSDRFQLFGKLGEGGMGVVYEAHDKERDMRVALKTLRHLDASSLYRFKREFRALSDLSHPNIVALYELVSEGDDWFLTMELVTGDDFVTYARPPAARRRLRMPTDNPSMETPGRASSRPGWPPGELGAGSGSHEVVARPGPERLAFDALIDEHKLRAALVQLAQALHALHTQGMVHRDLKPSNVRVTDAGRVVLMDFGIAAEAHVYQDSPSSAVSPGVGTPVYMAPEQAAGDAPTAAADWYALGVMLYLAMTGQLPYRGPRDRVLVAKQERDPPPPRELVAGVPEDLERLCMQLLSRRPHERPHPEDLLRRLGVSSGDNPVTADTTLSGVHMFVGRDAELVTLRSAFEDALRSQTVSVVVRGASGVGKSALLKRFTHELDGLAGEPAMVLTGRCHERESLSYKAWDGVIDDLSRELLNIPKSRVADMLPNDVDLLTRLFPVLRRVPGIQVAHPIGGVNPSELRERAVQTLRALLGNLSDWRPLVIHLEDLQWADVDSLELLLALVRPATRSRILVLASLRTRDDAGDVVIDKAVGEAIRAFTDKHVNHVIDLAPLSADEQSRLVTRMLAGRALPVAVGEAFWSQSQGNPLLLAELLRYVEESPDRLAAGDHPRIEEVLGLRVARLPATARALLEVICVSGEPAPLWLLGEAIDQAAEERERAAGVLRVANLARVARPGYQPWLIAHHNKVRETVLEMMPDTRRRELHQRLAQALERWDHATVDALARHWLAAGDPQQATTYLVSAAETAAQKLAFDRAAALYQAALDQSPAGDSLALLRPLGDVLVMAGRRYQAAQVYERAAELAGDDDAMDLRRLAADHMLRSGRIEEGLERMGEVAQDLGVPIPKTRRSAALDRVRARSRLALRGRRFKSKSSSEVAARDLDRLDTLYATAISLGMVDPIRGAAVQARHMLAALRHGEANRVCRAMATELLFTETRSERGEQRAQAMSRDVLLQARKLADPLVLAIAHWGAGLVALAGDRFKSAEQSFAEAESLLASDVVGAQWELITIRYFLCLARIERGRVAEIGPLVRRALSVAERHRDVYAQTLFQSHPSTWLELFANRPDAALDAARDAWRLWPAAPPYSAHSLLLSSQTWIHLYCGDGDSAAKTLSEWNRVIKALNIGGSRTIGRETLHLRARVALARGDDADARRAIGKLRREPGVYARGLAAIMDAALAMRSGDADSAQRLLTDALAFLSEVDARHYGAAAQYRLGALLGGAQGSGAIEEAMAWAKEQDVAAPERLFDLLCPGA